MKNRPIQIRQMLLAMLCAFMAAGASAEVKEMLLYNIDRNTYTVIRDGKTQENALGAGVMRRMAIPERGEAEGTEYEVTVKAIVGSDFSPVKGMDPVRAYNKTVQKNLMDLSYTDGGYEGKLSLPAGTYDFMFIASHNDVGHANSSDYTAFVIVENVEVSKATTVTFDVKTAVNRIQFQSYNHDGALSKQPVGHFVDNNTVEITNPGNIGSVNVINEIVHKDYNMLDYVSGLSAYVIEPSEAYNKRNDGLASMDYYVNNVSDKYEFRQVRHMLLPDGSSDVVILSQKGCTKSVTCVNNPADYFKADIRMAETPLSASYTPGETARPYGIFIGATLLGGEVPGLMGGVESNKKELMTAYVSPGRSTVQDPLAVIMWRDTYETPDAYYRTSTPYLYPVADESSKFGYYTKGQYDYGQNNQTYGDYYPGHPGLALTMSKDSTVFGDSCPFSLIAFYEMAVGMSEDMMVFEVESYGQKGERRGTDKLKTKLSLKYNGQEVLNDINKLDFDWPYNWVSAGGHFPGKYEMRVENENFRMGEIAGKNVAEVYFDQSKSDYYPPAIQGLQIRNKNGEFSVNFVTPDEGEIRIVGGDFNAIKEYQEDSPYYNLYYDLKPATLKVEYAPRGTEDFTEITARSNDNNYTYWGFNDFYRIPLDEITKKSADHWYDLRVTFTDAAGNYQRQLFSPAFFVKDVDAVETVAEERVNVSVENGILNIRGGEAPVVEIYDMAGMLLLRGNDTRFDLSGFYAGVYIIRVSDRNATTTLKITL